MALEDFLAAGAAAANDVGSAVADAANTAGAAADAAVGGGDGWAGKLASSTFFQGKTLVPNPYGGYWIYNKDGWAPQTMRLAMITQEELDRMLEKQGLTPEEMSEFKDNIKNNVRPGTAGAEANANAESGFKPAGKQASPGKTSPGSQPTAPSKTSPGGTSPGGTSPGGGAQSGNYPGGVNYNPPPSVPNESPDLPPIGGAAGGAGGQGVEVGPIMDPGQRPMGQGYTANVSSLFDFLPQNFNQMSPEQRLSAIIGAVTRRQEQGLQASLKGYDAAQQERIARGAPVRALENRILGDTDVMSEADIQRISGKTSSEAADRANVLGRALEERRAAAGSARSGSAQTEQSAVLQNAMNTAIQAESDIRAGARRENFQSRQQALQSAGGSIRDDVRLGAGIAADRSRTINDSQVLGDAFLTQSLLNPSGPSGQSAAPGGGAINPGGVGLGGPVPVGGNQGSIQPQWKPQMPGNMLIQKIGNAAVGERF